MAIGPSVCSFDVLWYLSATEGCALHLAIGAALQQCLSSRASGTGHMCPMCGADPAGAALGTPVGTAALPACSAMSFVCRMNVT